MELMKEDYSTTKRDIERDTQIEFFRGPGPGGQRRNRRETGVRLRHIPTGIVVESDEHASQIVNRKEAFERLTDQLKERKRPRKKRIPTKPSRSAKEERLKEKHIVSRKKEQRRLTS